jgi:ectoine hydroxylase-related dioxygenase (phytanoyl-CoA dioxygenase family)
MRNNKVKELVVPEIRNDGTHHWAVAAEYLVNKSVDNYIRETGSEPKKFYAKKGDVLVWHGKLMHRGSIPNDPTKLRPAMIAHYSNIRNRRDFSSEITRHGRGGYYWEFGYMGRPLTDDQFPRP